MSDRVRQFTEYRRRMNERILATDNRVVKRMFSLDALTYSQPGALDVKSRELMGLVASLVLRCDDCVSYHIAQAVEAGASSDEIVETMSIGLVVGGTIVIPHMRRAMEFLDELGAATDCAGPRRFHSAGVVSIRKRLFRSGGDRPDSSAGNNPVAGLRRCRLRRGSPASVRRVARPSARDPRRIRRVGVAREVRKAAAAGIASIR